MYYILGWTYHTVKFKTGLWYVNNSSFPEKNPNKLIDNDNVLHISALSPKLRDLMEASSLVMGQSKYF